MKKPLPHFRASVRIFKLEDGGPLHGFFSFPDSGIRSVPVEMEGVPGLNTVGFFHSPNAFIQNGQEFEADCCVVWEEGFYPAIDDGTAFRIWDGGFIASGKVLHVYLENWKVHVA